MIIVGDIAGNFNTLMLLLEQCPKDELVIAAGDTVDRGPRSKEVVEWLMHNAKTVKGNHEDMMLDYFRKTNRYDQGLWEMNGGTETLKSYAEPMQELHTVTLPDTHFTWLESLPKYLDIDGVVVTHAPINPVFGLHRANALPPEHNNGLLWNRGNINSIPGKFQVFGHQGLTRVQWYKKYDIATTQHEPFGVCIDTSNYMWQYGSKGMLTAFHWPSKKIYQQEVID